MPANSLVSWVVPALCLVTIGLACLVHAAGEASLTDAADTEVAILLKLRQAVHEADPRWMQGLEGWHPQDGRQPCSWEGINCDAQNRVVRIELNKDDENLKARHAPANHPNSSAGNGTAEPAAPLLPELAQLRRLRWLIVYRINPPAVWPGIPAEWGAPGAFPRLKALVLVTPSVAAPLPDIHPGALPVLEELTLRFHELHSTLPTSWGSSPQVLPSLTLLDVELQLQGQLPAEWVHGFRQLSALRLSQELRVDDGTVLVVGRTQPLSAGSKSDGGRLRASGGNSVTEAQYAAAQGRAEDVGVLKGRPVELPPEWAAGFPQLEQLQLYDLGIQGSIPDSWINTGFPALRFMSLELNLLTGTLPPKLFEHHPALTYLALESNSFTGTLPAGWGTCNVEHLSLGYNRLEGPAFPPAWISPGALPNLRSLMLSGNTAMAGTLPANLSWPKLSHLLLAGTRVTGSIPYAWCAAPFSTHLNILELGNTSVNPAVPRCASGMLQVNMQPMPNRTVYGRYSWMYHVKTAAELGPIDANRPRSPWPSWAQFPLLCLLLLLCAGTAAAAVVHGMRYQEAKAKAEWIRLPQHEAQLHSQKKQPGSAVGGTVVAHSSSTTLLTATQEQGLAEMRQLELQRLGQDHPLPYALVHCLGAASDGMRGCSHSGSFQQEGLCPPWGSQSMGGPRLLFEASGRSLPAWFAKVRAWLREPPLPSDASRGSSCQSSRIMPGIEPAQFSLDSRHSRATP